MIKPTTGLALPSRIVTRRDVSRLVNELESIDNDMTTAAVHEKIGAKADSNLPFSQSMIDFLHANNVALTTSQERSALLTQLRGLKDSVPVVHMTFSAEADPESLQQLTHWLRTSVHPQAVIEVGLQPSLVGGVYVRTSNKIHDLSMRAALKNGRQVLVKELGSVYAGR